MKNRIVIFFLLIASLVTAQSFNKFDSNGKRHGKWQKNFTDTKVLRYEGEFNHGKEIGTFKFYKNIEGKAVLTATRTFSKENNIAQVIFYTASKKKVSEGKMRGKTYIGEWLYYHKNSPQVMTKEFYNNEGQLEGVKTVYYLSGQIAETANYSKGKLNGESVWYSETGVKIRVYSYKDNLFHGLFQTYNTKGELLIEGHYRNDVKHGVWKLYKDGKLIEEKDVTKRSKNPYKKK